MSSRRLIMRGLCCPMPSASLLAPRLPTPPCRLMRVIAIAFGNAKSNFTSPLPHHALAPAALGGTEVSSRGYSSKNDCSNQAPWKQGGFRGPAALISVATQVIIDELNPRNHLLAPLVRNHTFLAPLLPLPSPVPCPTYHLARETRSLSHIAMLLPPLRAPCACLALLATWLLAAGASHQNNAFTLKPPSDVDTQRARLVDYMRDTRRKNQDIKRFVVEFAPDTHHQAITVSFFERHAGSLRRLS